MNRDKQIEEIAKVICTDCADYGKCQYDGICGATLDCARTLYTAGYRKTDEVNLITKLTDENEKLKAMVDMWKSTAYCEKDRLNSIRADTVERMKRDLYVEFIYIAGCQKDNEPNMRSQEVCEVLDKVVKKHLSVPSNDNLCVSCGEVIPEGRQVCPHCEKKNGRGGYK